MLKHQNTTENSYRNNILKFQDGENLISIFISLLGQNLK